MSAQATKLQQPAANLTAHISQPDKAGDMNAAIAASGATSSSEPRKLRRTESMDVRARQFDHSMQRGLHLSNRNVNPKYAKKSPDDAATLDDGETKETSHGRFSEAKEYLRQNVTRFEQLNPELNLKTTQHVADLATVNGEFSGRSDANGIIKMHAGNQAAAYITELQGIAARNPGNQEVAKSIEEHVTHLAIHAVDTISKGVAEPEVSKHALGKADEAGRQQRHTSWGGIPLMGTALRSIERLAGKPTTAASTNVLRSLNAPSADCVRPEKPKTVDRNERSAHVENLINEFLQDPSKSYSSKKTDIEDTIKESKTQAILVKVPTPEAMPAFTNTLKTVFKSNPVAYPPKAIEQFGVEGNPLRAMVEDRAAQRESELTGRSQEAINTARAAMGVPKEALKAIGVSAEVMTQGMKNLAGNTGVLDTFKSRQAS